MRISAVESSPTKKRARATSWLPDFQSTDLFHPERLDSEAALEQALSLFQDSFLTQATVEPLLAEAVKTPRLLDLLVSATSDDSFDIVSDHVLGNFPKTASAATDSSAFTILNQLSLSLLFLAFPQVSDDLETLHEYRRSVQLIPAVLRALSSSSFGDETIAACEDGLDDPFFKTRRAKPSQKQHKRAKKSAQLKVIDPAPFDKLDVDVPESQASADKLATALLNELKAVLMNYFDILRRPAVVSVVKAAYLPRKASVESTKSGVRAVSDGPAAADTSVAEAGSAYPMVQPMRAALYFDSADGFGDWRILISTRADRDLRATRKKEPKMFDIIIKKIKELSHGQFSADNQKKLTGPGTEIPIYEAKMTGDSRLVYQVDCIPEFDSDEIERQVLRIFGIYTHAQLGNGGLWDSMAYQLSRKGKEYRRRCNYRMKPHNKGDYVVMPASFPQPPEAPTYESAATSDLQMRPEDLDELHSLLVLEKFVTFSQALLNSILADQDVAHVFAVSPNEKAIIEHTSSCYVLGRSGTGKTTTMLFKILGIERSWAGFHGSVAKPRQMFVTASRVLASKVEEYFAKLLDSLATAAHSPAELAALAAAKLQQEEGLVDLDDEENWRGDLPKCFSQLQDEHFPLFITFDRLCKLLEGDIGLQTTFEDGVPQSPTVSTSRGGSLVTFQTFLQLYWPHFPQPMTKGLDPSLVYSEFMGVIKGSEEAMKHDGGYLDRKTYLALSHRQNSTFANQRDVVYNLFKAYLKRKREIGDHDVADRTRLILDHLNGKGLVGQKIDYLYVDEAQDNLLIDALMLRMICRNPDGLFWAGDTAQTISVGSSFRFNDLKAFLYRVEEQMGQGALGMATSTVQPKSFQLAINYRSHGGIVSCAHSLIQIITHFWPYAIDILGEEKGIIDGLKPVIFSGWDPDTLRYEQFLFGSAGDHMEFGAQQCILVRDDAAREKLRSEVGEIGVIMTLYESKGLEFNDVLLYNFFEDSTIELSQWRVILNMLQKDQRANVPAPRFDESRHAGVCSELKFLYVAITRARKNMWIIDCSEKGEPMRQLWTTKNLVNNITPGMDVPRLAVSSTPEEWAKSGRSLFRSKRYVQAMHCFDRAGLPREMAVAHAYHLREKARMMPIGSRHHDVERAQAYIAAGDAFVESAAQAPTEQISYYRVAGECYARASEDRKAARAYLNAKEYTLSAQHFRKVGMFDEAVEVVQTHRRLIKPEVAETLIDVARIYYLKEDKLEKVAKLFDTVEEQLEFLEDYDMDIARASLLVGLGRLSEAADIHLAEGRPQAAIEMLMSDSKNSDSVRRAKDCLLEQLWKILSFGIVESPHEPNTPVKGLLKLVSRLNASLLSHRDRDELAMFEAITTNDSGALKRLGQKFLLVEHDIPAALLCLDNLFSTPPRIQVADQAEVSASLKLFQSYVQLLRKLAYDPKILDDFGMRKLLALEESDQLFFVPAGSFLHSYVARSGMTVVRTTEEGFSLDAHQTSEVITRVVGGRLRDRVFEEELVCRRAKVFASCCLSHCIHGQCNRYDCSRQHVDVKSLTSGWYNEQVRLRLQQVLILQTLHSQLPMEERARTQRIWLSRLYEALFPPMSILGSASNVDLGLIPEAGKAIEVVKDWLRDLLYNLDPKAHQAIFLSTFYQILNVGLAFDGKINYDYVQRAVCMTTSRPQIFIRGNVGEYVLADIMDILSGKSRYCLARGTLFLKHVFDTRLPIDITVACDYMDFLTGSMIVSHRQFQNGSLHCTTLPRSWILHLSRTFSDFLGDRDQRLGPILLGVVPTLLECLVTGDNSDYLYFEGRKLAQTSIQIRQVFILRICRMLCLLGYNVLDRNLRDRIHKIVNALRRPGHRTYYMIAPYAEAATWDQLSRSVRQSISSSGSQMDEMIQLLYAPRVKGPQAELRGLRNVVYKTMGDIPRQLISHVGRPSAQLRGEAAPFIPSVRQTDNGSAEAEANATNAEAEKEAEEVMVEPAELEEGDQGPQPGSFSEYEKQDAADDAGVPAIDRPSQEISEAEVLAATIIQQAYRQARRRRRLAKSGLQATRDTFFDLCHTEAQSIPFQGTEYRHMYLGPLAHLLLCIDKISQYTRSAKKKAKRRLQDTKLDGLEELMNRQTKINQWVKRALELQKALGPKSALHQRRDVEELKKRVQDVVGLMQELPSESVQEVRDDMKLAVKGIVTPKPPPKKAEKPSLRVDVDDGDVAFEDEAQYVSDNLSEEDEEL